MNKSVFQPELIIEATTICDRACEGCYAPNVIVTKSAAASLYLSHPEMFLDPVAVKSKLNALPRNPLLISIRGGEPTQHPDLVAIIRACQEYTQTIVLETHGRWLLPENLANYKTLFSAVTRSNVVMKISFDQMHGLSLDNLKTITDILGFNNIQYLIAITELNDTDLRASRTRCNWVPDENIIYQPKVIALKELITPSLGVLTVKGNLVGTLSVKQEFLETSSLGISDRKTAAI